MKIDPSKHEHDKSQLQHGPNPKMPDWDPLSPDVLEHQQEANDRMRAQCPVAYSDFLGWSIFRHDDIVSVMRNPETFSNDVPTGLLKRDKSIPLNLDPPEHTSYRQLLSPYFSARRMLDFEPQSRRLAVKLMEPIIAAGNGEIVEQYTDPYPIQSLCAFLGWDVGDWRQIKGWASDLERAALRKDADLEMRTWNSWRDYIQKFIEARRTEPRSDVTSWLLEQEHGSVPLDDPKKISILRLLLHAGHGTTTASAGICLLYLARNQKIQDQLRALPDLIPSAIDEILRCDGPLVSMPRRAARDVEIRGRQIKAGDRLALMLMAADRDPEAFPDADQCQLYRKGSRHLLFGSGIHFCLGAPLARLELRITLEEFLARTRNFRLVQEAQIRRFRWPGNGPRKLPLLFESA
jgi:cytochrome P450